MLKLNLTNHTGSFVAQYTHGKNFDVAFLGNEQLLPNGNVPSAGARCRCSPSSARRARCCSTRVWPTPDVSYRAYVEKWVGIPYFPPSGAVRNNAGKATVYASWDGDTQVVGWRVLAGSSAQSLKSVATKAKTGFETTIPLSKTYKAYEVQALGPKSKVLGTSKCVPDDQLDQRSARRVLAPPTQLWRPGSRCSCA